MSVIPSTDGLISVQGETGLEATLPTTKVLKFKPSVGCSGRVNIDVYEDGETDLICRFNKAMKDLPAGVEHDLLKLFSLEDAFALDIAEGDPEAFEMIVHEKNVRCVISFNGKVSGILGDGAEVTGNGDADYIWTALAPASSTFGAGAADEVAPAIQPKDSSNRQSYGAGYWNAFINGTAAIRSYKANEAIYRNWCGYDTSLSSGRCDTVSALGGGKCCFYASLVHDDDAGVTPCSGANTPVNCA